MDLIFIAFYDDNEFTIFLCGESISAIKRIKLRFIIVLDFV